MMENRYIFELSEVQHLHNAVNIALKHGGNFLVNKIYPNGPIMREENLDYVHKATWGLYSAGVDKQIIWQIIDWIHKKALQPNGDFFFPNEEPEYKIRQRVYRPLNFLKIAALIGHPIIKEKKVIERIFQYQHKSGGAFNYIGEDPHKIEEQLSIGCLDTSFLDIL